MVVDSRVRRLVASVRRSLRERADPEKAEPMRAYMKSDMPFLGVQTPERRSACRAVFKGLPLERFEQWRDAVLVLWRDARFREERYAAIELTGHRLYDRFQTLDALPIYAEIVVTGAWWDYVDVVAGNRLDRLLRRYPRPIKSEMRRWSRCDDLWKRRSAILCQLSLKEQTDLKLLYDCVRPAMASREFFLRKAIGWALREYAKTDPGEVRRFVAAHETELSSLSKREALKNLQDVAGLAT
jgi:3-methyladenine DNA glycosylase AlkD